MGGGQLRIFIWGFPKIGGKNPKWMVKILEHPINMDDLGGPPLFWKHPYNGGKLRQQLYHWSVSLTG